jgi:hypothetical protein
MNKSGFCEDLFVFLGFRMFVLVFWGMRVLCSKVVGDFGQSFFSLSLFFQPSSSLTVFPRIIAVGVALYRLFLVTFDLTDILFPLSNLHTILPPTLFDYVLKFTR